MKYASINIDDSLHTVFKRTCNMKGLKMSKLIESLIKEWLEKQAKGGN
jgi:hypothetical protein